MVLSVCHHRTREEWTGIWIQSTGDWNRGSGIGEDLTGATRLTFYARGEHGGEIVTFAYGYFNPPGQNWTTDSAHENQEVILTDTWQEYSFDLTLKDLSSISGLFMVYIDENRNPENFVFYLDNITYHCSQEAIN